MSEGILIIGGGIAGAATAWWLAQGGARRVALVEREPQLGIHSSGRNAAILRTAIDAEPTRDLALETAAFLADPPTGFSDFPLVDPCGLVIVEAEGPERPTWTRSLEHRDDVNELAPVELAAVAPHFRPEGSRAWHFRREGRIDIAALLDAFARGARAGGVDLRTNARVTRLVVEQGRVAGVELEDGTRLEAAHIVIGAGGWASRLGRSAGSRVAIRPTRRHLMVTGVDSQVDPNWPIVWEDGGFYARPESGGLLLCACDQTDIDPDRCEPDSRVRESIARKTAIHLPQFADARAAHFWAGIRALSPDDRPYLGPDPDVPGLFWVAGLGGHGMSTSAAVGRIAAERLLAGGGARNELERALDPGRFPAEQAVHGAI